MKKRYWFLILVVLATAITICRVHYLQTRHTMGHSLQVNENLISANTGFAFRLFKNLALKHSAKNVVMSPTSVSLALAMVYNGTNGKTREEMASTLGIERMSLTDVNESNADLMENLNNPEAGMVLETANGLWATKRYALAPDFLSACKEYYDAEVDNVDFANPSAKSSIDRWVNKKTHGRVSEIAEGLDELTVLCLINAIYFKSAWALQFDKAITHDELFTLANRKTQNVPMMQQEGNFQYYESEDFKAVALPYSSRRMSMYIFVPRSETDLPKFLRKLNASNWNAWMSGFRETKVKVSLPRWKLECEINLKKPCSDLGMAGIFNPGCDFSRVCKSGAKDVFISVLKQKAFIEVNEEGTEAAAATVVVMSRSCCPEIRVNRPFFYAIRDDTTGTLLFMGTVVNPTLDESTL